MKSKIIFLFAMIFCLAAALTSCGGAACDAHKDEDRNSVCDNCGVAVVTITETVEGKPEIVDTVVTPIPEGANRGDVFTNSLSAHTINSAAIAKLDLVPENAKDVQTGVNGNFFMAMYYTLTQTAGADTAEDTSDDKYDRVDTTLLYNLALGKEAFRFNSAPYDTVDEVSYRDHIVDADEIKDASNNIIAYSFQIKRYTYDADKSEWSYEHEYLIKSVSGSDIAAASDTAFQLNVDNSNANYTVLTVDDTVYVVDNETATTFYSVDKNLFVNRPANMVAAGDYGYIKNGNSVYVYDLTKWLECVYRYDIPAMYESSSAWYLENGFILVQGVNALPADAANYDMLDNGVKYDIVYTLVDVAAKTATDVEFGYYINNVTAIDSEDYKDGVDLIIDVNTVEDRKKTDKILTLYCGNDLSIKGEKGAMHPDLMTDYTVVAANRILVTITYGEGSVVQKMYDEKGTFLFTLPNNATVYAGLCISIDDKFYGFDNLTTPILDLKQNAEDDTDDLSIVATHKDYLVMADRNGVRYQWTAGKGLVRNVSFTDVDETTGVTTQYTALDYKEEFIVVEKTVTTPAATLGESDTVVTTYIVYNENGDVALEVTEALYVYVGSNVYDDFVVFTFRNVDRDVYYVAK